MKRSSGKIKIKQRVVRRRGGWNEGEEVSKVDNKGLEASRDELGNMRESEETNFNLENELQLFESTISFFATCGVNSNESDDTDLSSITN